MQGNMEPNHDNADSYDPRTNTLRNLEQTRMKKREDQVPRTTGTRQRSARIPIPPTPPAREVDPSALTFLFEKRLKYSDIKDEGRIVVPKSFAEKFMPALETKEGFFIFMDDISEVRVWRFRYRFWPNNSSRVYVLENTTEFVKTRHLRIGDFMMIFKDNETQRFAIGLRRSTDQETAVGSSSLSTSGAVAVDDQNFQSAAAAGAVMISTSSYTSGQSGSSSSSLSTTNSMAVVYDDQNFHANPELQAMAGTSSYSDGLQDFPMHLLDMDDIIDLPEF